VTVVDDPPALELSQAQITALRPDYHEWVEALDGSERQALLYRWGFWRRPSQAIPAGMGPAYRTWMVRAGRGYGKTRTGSETTRQMKNRVRRIALIGRTAADVRDVMIEGESGILATAPPWDRPKYEPSKRRVLWDNGALATAYAAEEPDALRGPQHEWAWGDEPASWKYGQETFDNLLFGLRLGRAPWAMLTGTPKPVQWLRDLTSRDDCVTTTGTTYDNAGNLAPTFLADMLGRYEGTRLGRQELHAQWLDDVEGSLWKMATLDRNRMRHWSPDKPWTSLNEWLFANGQPMIVNDRRPWRIIMAVDPPGTTAECGIVVGAFPDGGVQGRDHGVILDDSSTAGAPEVWGKAVADAYRRWGVSVCYVENNQGGEMCRSTIHVADRDVNVQTIHADESKTARAEPIAALDANGWLHHVGVFGMLEAQMTTWVPGEGKSPDRIDARVHVVREGLKVREVPKSSVQSPVRGRAQGLRVPTPRPG
jgi:phage terminase large subunit-like protein